MKANINLYPPKVSVTMPKPPLTFLPRERTKPLLAHLADSLLQTEPAHAWPVMLVRLCFLFYSCADRAWPFILSFIIVGKYQSQPSSTFCIEAEVGAFVQNSSATASVPCTPGRYAPTRALTACLLCPIGMPFFVLFLIIYSSFNLPLNGLFRQIPTSIRPRYL
jgi:hypothetical protein